MKVWVIWEHCSNSMRIKEIWNNQEHAYSRLLSLTDFPDPVDADYTIEEWSVKS